MRNLGFYLMLVVFLGLVGVSFVHMCEQLATVKPNVIKILTNK